MLFLLCKTEGVILWVLRSGDGGVSQLSYDSSVFVTDRAGQLFKSLNSTEKIYFNLIINFSVTKVKF